MKANFSLFLVSFLAVSHLCACSPASAPNGGQPPTGNTGNTLPSQPNPGQVDPLDPNDAAEPSADPGLPGEHQQPEGPLDGGESPSDAVPMTVAELGENLSGIWRGNSGTRYYVRHSNNLVMWYSQSVAQAGDSWHQAGVGELSADKKQILMTWYSLPGADVSKKGKLRADLQPGERLVLGNYVGPIGDESWQREQSVELPEIEYPHVLSMMPQPAEYNLSGVWTSDDGGRYFIRHDGNRLIWFGQQKPSSPDWANIAFGSVNGKIASLNWADLPKGQAEGFGHISLKAIDHDHLVRTDISEGFAGSNWVREELD
ncbi:MAG: hypothetical protein ACAI44_22505 [Candidatus Sericytochromatia bacterium]